MRDRRIDMPPVFHIEVDPKSAVDVKGAYVEGLSSFAIKMASGFSANAAKGLANIGSFLLLIDSETGFCEAEMLDTGYLTNPRSSLAGTVAAAELTRKQVVTVCVLGMEV